MKHLIFDLDGTLGNTLPLCIAAFREAIEPLAGRAISDQEIVATFGPSEEGTVVALVPDDVGEALQSYLASYDRLHVNWPSPFPGILELLEELRRRGTFLGLVTGKGPRSTELTLQRYGLSGHFEVVETGSPLGPIKDQKIEDIIRRYSFGRDDVLYVGDSTSDVTAARACGIRIAAAAWAPTAEVEALRATRPDHLFTSVSDFARVLGVSLDG